MEAIQNLSKICVICSPQYLLFPGWTQSCPMACMKLNNDKSIDFIMGLASYNIIRLTSCRDCDLAFSHLDNLNNIFWPGFSPDNHYYHKHYGETVKVS